MLAVEAGVWREEEQEAGELSFGRLVSSCLSGCRGNYQLLLLHSQHAHTRCSR